MDKVRIVLPFAAILLVALGVSCGAAPSVLGTSGNILTPDDTILAPGGFNLGYHGVNSIGNTSENVGVFAANIGLLPKLEVGLASVADGDSEVIINGKYRLLSETLVRPAVTVGAIDAGARRTNERGAYIVLSKNLTPFAEEIANKTSRPIRGHLGFGGGVVKGAFVGLDFTLTPKLSVMAEYISDSELRANGGEGLCNAGVRYTITKMIRLDLGTINFEDLTFGASFQALRF